MNPCCNTHSVFSWFEYCYSCACGRIHWAAQCQAHGWPFLPAWVKERKIWTETLFVVGQGEKKKKSKHSGLNHTRKAVQHVADIWRYVFMLKWEESTFMLTNAKCVRPKGRKDASWQRAPECMECEFMRAFCVRGRARASLCLPVCLCVREREGEQNGLRGTLCFNWWHVARWKSTLQIPVLTGACSCPEDTQSTQAPRTSCVQTFLTL